MRVTLLYLKMNLRMDSLKMRKFWTAAENI